MLQCECWTKQKQKLKMEGEKKTEEKNRKGENTDKLKDKRSTQT